jgi:hypothetical protein
MNPAFSLDEPPGLRRMRSRADDRVIRPCAHGTNLISAKPPSAAHTLSVFQQPAGVPGATCVFTRS